MSQDLKAQFLQAEKQVNEGKAQIPETLKMKLYGLAKQAKEGDCRMPQPPVSNVILKAKWDNWMACSGMTMEKAMEEYTQIVSKLEPAARSESDKAVAPATTGSTKKPTVAAAAAVANEGPVKKGVLYKQRDLFKGWRPRHFVLQDNFLHYYLDSDDPLPRNSLDLTGCNVTTSKPVIVDGVEYFPFVISHPKSTKTYNLSSDSKLEADIWVAKIIDAANLPVNNTGTTSGKEPGTPSSSAASALAVKSEPVVEEPSDPNAFFLDSTVHPSETRSDTPRPLMQKIEKLCQELIDCAPMDSAGWDPLWVKDGLVAKKKASSNMIWVKAQIVLPFSMFDVFNFITDIQNQRELDPGRLVHERIKCYSNHTWVDYIRYKGLWPTSPRDFVNVAHWRMLQDGRVMIVGFGEKYDDLRPPVDGHVRGEMHLGGYLLTHTPQGTQLDYVVKLDLKGSIPGTVVNLVSNSQPMILLTLKQLMQKAKQRGSILNPADKRTSYSEIVTYIADELYKSCGGANGGNNNNGNGGAAASTTAAASNATAAAASTTPATTTAAAKKTPVGKGSTLLKQAARIPHINMVSLMIVFLPVLLYYVLSGTKWRAVGFLAGTTIAVSYLLRLHLGRTINKSATQLKNQVTSSKLLFRFPIELQNIVQYIESKRRDSEVDITFSHIAIKAAAMAIAEIPSLNGHVVMDHFYRSKTPAVDVSVSVDLSEGVSVMTKVRDCDAKPVEYIANEVITTATALRSGEQNALSLPPLAQKLNNVLPTILGMPVRHWLHRLGALYGLNIPALGIEAFPQGVCAIVSSPTADTSIDLDIAVIPDVESEAPITVTMGGLRLMPVIEDGGMNHHGHLTKRLGGSRVLNFTICVSSKAASLAEARKFSVRFQQFMNDPSLMEKVHEKAQFDRVEAAKRKSAFGGK